MSYDVYNIARTACTRDKVLCVTLPQSRCLTMDTEDKVAPWRLKCVSYCFMSISSSLLLAASASVGEQL